MNRPFARRSACSRFAVAALIIALAAAPSTRADTWDNETNLGGGWSTNLNWVDNTEPTISDPVIFPTPIPFGDSTVTLSAIENAASLTFNDSYTLGANFLNIGGTGSVFVASGKSATINSVLNGGTGLAKSGAGTLTLTGSNSFLGTISFPNSNGGVLVIRANNSLGNAANAVNLFSGTLRVAPTGTNQTITMARAITIGALGATIEVTGNNPTLNITQAIGGSVGTLDIRGNGNLGLSVASPRSASTRIFDCAVRVTNAAGLGSGPVTLGSDPLVGDIGTIEIPNGVNFVNFVTMDNGGALRGAGALGVFGGTCNVTATGRLIGGFAATDTLRIGNVGSALSGGPGTLVIVQGPGIVLTNVPNNYEGDWRIDSGTLKVGHTTGLGVATTPIVVNSGGTLLLSSVSHNRATTLNTGSTLAFEQTSQQYGSVAIASGAQVTLDTRTTGIASIGSAPNSLTGGGGAMITVTGNNPNATLDLSFPSDYVGSWQVNGGEIQISDDSSLGPVTNAFYLNTNGALRTNSNLTLTRVITTGGGTLRAEGTSTAMTLAAGLDGGNAALSTTGTGRVILQAPSLRNGDTHILGGILRVEHPTALGINGFGQVHVGIGSTIPPVLPTLELGDVAIVEDVRLDSDGATLRGVGTSANDGSVSVAAGVDARLETGSSPSDVLSLGGVDSNLFGGSGGSTITVAGAGRVVRTRSAAYLGTWILASGTLEIDADNRLGAAATTVQLTGGTLSTSASFASSRTLSTQGGTILTQPFTTLTLSSPLNAVSGSLFKDGDGTLVLSQASSRTGSTAINAGTIEVSGTSSGLGSGIVTINNQGKLQLSNATHTVGAGGIIINNGGLLRASGTCAYSCSGFPAIANGSAGDLVSAAMDIPSASGVLTLNSAIRNVTDGVTSFATLVKSGAGKLVLRTGGTSATDIFGGSWNLQSGILQVGPTSPSGETLNALGFKNGDPKQANTIEINGGTLAVGTLNSVAGNPDFLRAGVILRGGAIASTAGIDAKYGGHFRVHSVFNSKVQLFDPSSTATARNVSLVAGAAGADNLASDTTWDAGSTLIVDPGTTTGGAFNIERTGGTVSVGPNAVMQINSGATVNLGGTLDALSDGVEHVNIVNNSTTSLNVTAGIKHVGTVDGLGNTTINAGASLSAAHISQNALTVNGNAILRVDAGSSALSSLNALNVSGGLGVTLAGAVPGSGFSQLQINGNAALAGTLDIVRANGFEPAVGQSFVSMTFASRSGSFTNVTGTAAGPGRMFSVQYNPFDVTLVVVGQPDLNCDGSFNTSDAQSFALALADPDAYAAQFPTCDSLNGDMNQDLVLNGLDIAPFVSCLVHGGCQ